MTRGLTTPHPKDVDSAHTSCCQSRHTLPDSQVAVPMLNLQQHKARKFCRIKGSSMDVHNRNLEILTQCGPPAWSGFQRKGSV